MRRYANGILVCPLLNYLLEVDIDEVVLVFIVMVVEEVEENKVGEEDVKVVADVAVETFCKFLMYCMYVCIYV